MNEQKINDIIKDVLSSVLKISISDNELISRAEYSVWDSLKHIEIIFALEGELGLTFSEQDVVAIRDSADIKRLIELKLEP